MFPRRSVLLVTTSRQSKDHFLDPGTWTSNCAAGGPFTTRPGKIGKAIATLDLSVPNNIPAVLVDAGPAPPASPRTKTPQHIRKKNV